MFFVGMSVVKIPVPASYRILTLPLVGYGVIGTGLIFLGMPFGEWLMSKIPARRFDDVIQILLFLMVLSAIFNALRA
tara:strand:+ start:1266 stop:1496 length:231 start_codon:yes stop_codon:yes gene_type:complete